MTIVSNMPKLRKMWRPYAYPDPEVLGLVNNLLITFDAAATSITMPLI